MSSIPTSHEQIMTIERHILQEQEGYPDATGVLTSLLYDIALAGKFIASNTTRAGLSEILGSTDEYNIQGEQVMKLDRLADQAIYRLNDHAGRLAVLASEEHEDILPIPDKYPTGKYVLLYDPIDGSSNIDYNVSIGTIFSIYQRKTLTDRGSIEDCLQPGRDLIAAGYLLYSVSTMLVYSTGAGVHGFTLDPSIGEFLLSHHNIKIPEPASYFSVNHGYTKYWSQGIRHFTEYLEGLTDEGRPLSDRYIGSLVGDFHRNLLAGGIFYYPADSRDPEKPSGKLRLLYEAAPLAFICSQAGGYASNGYMDILDIQPDTLHQRTPLFIGSRDLVEKAEQYLRKYG